eukprot:1525128-Prymnesium_polylepis.4
MAMNDAHYNVMNMIDIHIRATDAHGYLAAGYLECVADVIISGQMTALTASDPFVVLSLHHFMQYNSYHYWQYVERMLAGEADRSVTTLMGKMGLASLLETAGFDFRGLITYDGCVGSAPVFTTPGVFKYIQAPVGKCSVSK